MFQKQNKKISADFYGSWDSQVGNLRINKGKSFNIVARTRDKRKLSSTRPRSKIRPFVRLKRVFTVQRMNPSMRLKPKFPSIVHMDECTDGPSADGRLRPWGLGQQSRTRGIFCSLFSKWGLFFGAYFFHEIEDSTVGERENYHLSFTAKRQWILSVRSNQKQKTGKKWTWPKHSH